MSAAAAAAKVHFEDCSARPRCGCKGPGAERWLREQGYRVTSAVNSVAFDGDGILVARLASSEFLIDAVDSAAAGAGGGIRVRSTRAYLNERSQPRDVYAVTRQDTVMTLSGAGLNVLLQQVCGVDFAPLLDCAADNRSVVLTSMVGVGVVAWPRRLANGAALTVWCEPSYAHYFWSTLREVSGSGR